MRNKTETHSVGCESPPVDVSGSIKKEIVSADGNQRNTDLSSCKQEKMDLNLDTIPVEVLLQIFQYVDATDLLTRVSLVSKYFNAILSNNMTWKIKQEKRWGNTGDQKYPPINLHDDGETGFYSLNFTHSTFPWSVACVKREEQIRIWSSNRTDMVEISSHIGCIDSVHLYVNQNTTMLACGSRDRTISIWNVDHQIDQSEPNKSRVKIINRAHEGWIWDFGVNHSHLVSCSWDTFAKTWDYNTFQTVNSWRSTSAVLSVSCSENLIGLGTYNRKIQVLDPRMNALVHEYTTSHKKSILSLGLDSNYLISCGDDGYCVKHDVRTNAVLTKLKLPASTYPTCMSFRDTTINLPYFYIGDNTGNIHLVDLLNFKIITTLNLNTVSVRGVFHNLGSVLSCFKNGVLSIMDPTASCKPINTVRVGDKIELTCVHSINNILVCGGGDGVVRVWGNNL